MHKRQCFTRTARCTASIAWIAFAAHFAVASDATQVYEKVVPSVVSINWLDAASGSVFSGTGFIVSADGIVCTSHHVVEGASAVYVTTSDGTTHISPGWVSSDEAGDVTLIRLLNGNYKAIDISYPYPKIGSEVFAIGNPEGFQYSITNGIVSGLRPFGSSWTGIQNTAAVNHGSSGGPLVDTNGAAVGVVRSSREDSQGLNFAVSAQSIQRLLPTENALVRPFPVTGGLVTPAPVPTVNTRSIFLPPGKPLSPQDLIPKQPVNAAEPPTSTQTAPYRPKQATAARVEPDNQDTPDQPAQASRARWEASNLSAFKSPKGRIVLTSNPDKFRNRRGYTEVDPRTARPATRTTRTT